jgi:amidase
MANLLDYSACVIPVTRADKNVDVADPNHKALGDLDQKNWDACEFFLSFLLQHPIL